jgi:kumamolisin
MSLVPLPGSERPSLEGAEEAGGIDVSEPIEVTLIMRRIGPLRRGSAAGAVVGRDELARLYGADPADAERVRDIVTRLGLEVTETNLQGAQSPPVVDRPG